MNHQRAFNLIDLIVTLALLSTLASVGIPSFSRLLNSARDNSIQDQLLAILSHTRSQAIIQRTPMKLCGSSTGTICNHAWHHRWIINSESSAARTEYSIDHAQGLSWRGFSRTITFMPNGSSPTGNGRFVLCRDNSPVWELVINRQGRVREVAKNQLTSSCTTSRPST